MKPAHFLVMAQYGGRRYVVSTPKTRLEAVELCKSLTEVQKAQTRQPGQAMTRYAVYKLEYIPQ